MATYTIVKLKNLTPLHIGTGKENYDFSADDLQSDTISAALASIYAQEKQGADIESFMNSFTISSAFPYIDNHYFLPKMHGKINVEVEGTKENEYGKELKKIKYIELSLWQQLTTGRKPIIIKGEQIYQNYLLTEYKTFSTPARSQVMQRVTIPRCDGQDAEPFYFNWTYFSRLGGLYFIIDSKTKSLTEIIHLFKLLGEVGIGTDRNVGGGKFEVEVGSIDINQNPKSNATMLLSLYVPTKDEMEKINLENSYYQILQRGGYMAGSSEEDFRHLRKKSIYMFGVGTVFPITEPLSGKVLNLTPDWNDKRMHPVYRSGKPFYLPVTI